MRSVRLSKLAFDEIEQVGREIAADKPHAAEAFVGELIARCHSIADAPEGYDFRPDYGIDVRGVTVGPYLILYRVRPRDIFILSIRHGARRPVTFK
ncbi:type II toxin-antitoxin system RelE/ParE family toxin [Caulobacter sp. B11]|uniref:type II toxin-antitoxin system RelE/ParE family toxin n=1 Tax=Caulobacter sp. B11 TaxID=2048899 RepID=UPI00191BA184|nr:type II toxin-antitoxin system RelE/ParE family toxin [Caulobacter sp. B11]